jgi:hypothetical protein
MDRRMLLHASLLAALAPLAQADEALWAPVAAGRGTSFCCATR